jgi:cytochrome c556
MRIAFLAISTCILLLSGCGGPETSQANNAQANISNDSREANQAATSNLEARVSLGDAPKVMHARHEGMETIGKDFKVLHREFESATPNLALVRTAAGQVAGLSRQASGWFPEGTGPELGKTGAKPEIWLPENKADFAAKLRAFQRAAAAFDATTTRNDVAAMKGRYADLGGACKACHDKYRTDMHH